MPYDVSVVFREDSSLHSIEIQISAPERCEQVKELLARLSEKERFIDLPSDGGRIVRMRTDNIIRVCSQNRKNYVYADNETIWTSSPISELYAKLGSCFLRISRFEIINLDRAWFFDFFFFLELKIVLEGNHTVYASRRYIPVIRDYLKGGRHE